MMHCQCEISEDLPVNLLPRMLCRSSLKRAVGSSIRCILQFRIKLIDFGLHNCLEIFNGIEVGRERRPSLIPSSTKVSWTNLALWIGALSWMKISFSLKPWPPVSWVQSSRQDGLGFQLGQAPFPCSPWPRIAEPMIPFVWLTCLHSAAKIASWTKIIAPLSNPVYYLKGHGLPDTMEMISKRRRICRFSNASHAITGSWCVAFNISLTEASWSGSGNILRHR